MKAWRVVQYGRPTEALRLEDIPTPEPGDGELRVRNTATVLNYNEVDGCRGRYLTVNPPLPYTLGMELVGVVEAVGAGGGEWLGRRVVSTAVGAFGAHAEAAIVSADMTFDAPDTLDDIAAAAFFFPFHLAGLGLFVRGRLTAGQTVLVHAGAGGVGSAAVQLAAVAGARVIATAGGDEKVARCRTLGADVAIDYRATDFVDVVNEVTKGRGVDLVFDGVGGDVGRRSLRCVAMGGLYLIVGFASGIEAEEIATVTPRTLCFGNFSVGGVMLSYTSHPDAARAASGFNIMARRVGEDLHDRLVQQLRAGEIAPVIGGVVPFDDLPAALDRMEERATIGRIVVDVAGSNAT
jgi:NADPH:quinone reductase